MSAPASRAVAVPVPPAVLVWQFGGKTGNLTAQNTYTPNSGYNMLCKSNGEHLTYAKQPVGINLGYTKNSAERKVHFQLPDHRQREILTGEPVALGIGGGDEWLYYSERPTGINLNWRAAPSFTWRIWDPTGQSGKKIQQNTVVAVLNVDVKPTPDFLVYLDRHPGVADVGWTTSPNWWGSLGLPLIDLVKKLLG